MYTVRAEITGQFVINDNFESKEKALEEYNSLVELGIWDDVDIWEV